MISINRTKFLLALTNTQLTSTQIAEKAGVSRVVISKVVNNKQSTMRPQTLGKIARALSVKVEDLI